MVGIATGKLMEEITDKQRDSLIRLAWRFRRQWRGLDDGAWRELFDRMNPAAIPLSFGAESCEDARQSIEGERRRLESEKAGMARHNALERVHG